MYYEAGNSGLYNVGYIPTVKGQYSISVKIDNVDIETDLSSGVWVYSAKSSAVHSTLYGHDICNRRGHGIFYYSSN